MMNSKVFISHKSSLFFQKKKDFVNLDLERVLQKFKKLVKVQRSLLKSALKRRSKIS